MVHIRLASQSRKTIKLPETDPPFLHYLKYLNHFDLLFMKNKIKWQTNH